MKNSIVNRLKDYQFIVLSGVFLFPLTPRLIESILIILLVALAICNIFIQNNFFWNKHKTKQLLMIGAIFIIFALTSIYSTNVNAVFKYIKTLAPIILLPTVFLVYKTPLINNLKLDKLLNLYLIALFLILLLMHINCFNSMYINKTTNWVLRNEFENFTDVHGTYLAMWIGFGILTLAYKAKDIVKFKFSFILGVFTFVYFLYWLFIIEARMPIIATFISVIVFYLLKYKVSFKKTVIFLFFILVGFLFVFQGYVFSKWSQLTDYKSAFPEGKYEVNFTKISNENIRSGIYYCATKTIEYHPFIGIGIGDVDDALQLCYEETYQHTDVFSLKKYNSHSEYLLILLASGFLGFSLFILSLFYLFKESFKKTSPLYTCFLIFVLLCFCFENILSRHDGVIFFSLINTVLFFSEEKEALKKTFML